MTAHNWSSPVTEQEILALHEWMRQPDWADNFSLEDMAIWINQRPTSVTARLVDDGLAQAPPDGDEMDDFIRAVLADNNPRSDEPYATVAKWIRLIRLAYPVPEKASPASSTQRCKVRCPECGQSADADITCATCSVSSKHHSGDGK